MSNSNITRRLICVKKELHRFSYGVCSLFWYIKLYLYNICTFETSEVPTVSLLLLSCLTAELHTLYQNCSIQNELVGHENVHSVAQDQTHDPILFFEELPLLKGHTQWQK